MGKEVDRSAYINKEVEATIHFAVVQIEAINDNKQVMRLIANGDPKMKLPGWFINQAIKLVVIVFLKTVAKKAENLPDDYK